jgi:HSP20 family protein
MADIVRRGDYAMAPMTEWDPLRMMREMMRWDPFRMIGLPMAERDVWMPRFEVRESASEIRVIADVPGLGREDLEISVTGNRLMISGHRDVEDRGKDESVHTYEREYGQFTRTFTLPDNVDLDHITSELRDGVLTITVPMAASARARKIQIGGTAPKQ